MTKHLSSEECVDVLDRPLSAERQSHLATCESCAAQLAEMRSLMGDVTIAGAVPEPSPLFWDHLSARVREAVDAEPVPVPLTWWQASWRPMLALAGVAGAVLVAVLARPSFITPRAVTPEPAAIAAAVDEIATPESNAMWDMIHQIAPSLRIEDAQAAGMMPGSDATDSAIESLTQPQRQELMKLLRKEMRSAE